METHSLSLSCSWSLPLKASIQLELLLGWRARVWHKRIQNLYCCLSRPLFGERKCPHSSVHIEVGQPYPQHLFSHHLKHFNLDTVIFWLENKNYSSLQKQFHHSIFNETHRHFEIPYAIVCSLMPLFKSLLIVVCWHVCKCCPEDG